MREVASSFCALGWDPEGKSCPRGISDEHVVLKRCPAVWRHWLELRTQTALGLSSLKFAD